MVSSVRASAMSRLRIRVAASAEAVCSVIQKIFLRGLNNMVRYLPVITSTSWFEVLAMYIAGWVGNELFWGLGWG